MISDAGHGPGVPQFGARRFVGPVLLAVAMTAIGLSALLPDSITGILRYERGPVAALEWWRLVTAHVVHLGAAHACMNAAALGLIAWIARGSVSLREWLWLAVASAAAIDAGLYWLLPGLVWYVGASGVLHGLFAGAAVLLAGRGRGVQGAVMLLALGAKIAYESFTGVGLSAAGGADLPVVTQSHLYGAVGGLVTGLALSSLCRAYNRGSQTRPERRN